MYLLTVRDASVVVAATATTHAPTVLAVLCTSVYYLSYLCLVSRTTYAMRSISPHVVLLHNIHKEDISYPIYKSSITDAYLLISICLEGTM